jgi:hypothetical protein
MMTGTSAFSLLADSTQFRTEIYVANATVIHCCFSKHRIYPHDQLVSFARLTLVCLRSALAATAA